MRSADDIMQRGTTVGDGATLTMGVKVSNRRLFRAKFPTGTWISYCDRTTRASPNGDKREYGKGFLTWGVAATGEQDTISRTTVSRSTNDDNRVDWLASDIHQVYSAPLLDWMSPLLFPTWETESSTFNIDASHYGKTIDADVSAGGFAVNLTSISTLGPGFKCRLWGFGHATNVLTLVPAGGQIINELSADATLPVPPKVMTTLEINDTRARWRIY